MNFEFALIFLSETKFITPIILSLFGGLVRSLQRPYVECIHTLILRIFFMVLGGGIISLLVFDDNEMFVIVSSLAYGYFTIDVVDLFCHRIFKK